MVADRRLRHRQMTGGVRQVGVLEHGNEVSELFQVHRLPF